MSVLHHRIVTQHNLLPPGNLYPHPSGTPETPMVMPMAQVTYASGGAGLSYEDMEVFYAADGAPYAATGHYPWGQVVPAGRP